MGANSSSLSELPTNPYLQRLTSSEVLSKHDPFWNQLLSFSFQIPTNSADQRLLEESTLLLCKNFTINNCKTGNFGALTRVFMIRATELKASTQCEDNIFTWQTYNALFIIRNVCKYFVENLTEEVVLEQFECYHTSKDDDRKSVGEDPVAEQLMNSLVEILVDVPVVDSTYAIHLESLNTLMVLLSMQMFQPQHGLQSRLYQYIMQGKCSIHACVLMKTLMQNFMKQEKCPASLIESSHESGFYNFTATVASSLWSVMTLGMASKTSQPEELIHDTLLANQSMLFMLILTNHCTSEELHNPYRESLFSCTNSQDQPDLNTNPSAAMATFQVDFTKVYDSLCQTLHDDQATLFLYLLLHQNPHVKSFILSRTNMDQLVMPILKILYYAQEKNSHHIYMALIILLILSEDDYFNKAVHETNLKNVIWFKERNISEITLGGLLVLVVIRTIQYNMTRMRDKYLHTNCLAALANMSSNFHSLHPYVTQRLVSLFALLMRKHMRLIDQIRNAALEGTPSVDSGSDTESEVDYVQDLAVLEEVIRMVLEIINSCLSHTLHHNPNLIYTLLYQKELFSHFRTHPTFQDIIQNIDTVLSYFQARVEKQTKSLSVNEILDVVKQGAVQFKRERLKKFPDLKFKYVEEDQPEEFFIPYVWSLVYHSSNLYFNPSKIQLFSLHS